MRMKSTRKEKQQRSSLRFTYFSASFVGLKFPVAGLTIVAIKSFDFDYILP